MATQAGPGNGSHNLRIGVVGLGGAARQMIGAFDRHPHVEITAAADIDPGVLERFKANYPVETYLTCEELCASPNVDAVYIATPNQFHTEHVMAALSHGKHVQVEKPMALTLEEAEEMVAAAERAGVRLGVNVKHSFEPRIQRLRRLVTSGELGRLRMIQSWYFNDWLYRPRTGEELNPELGGGVPWRQGPHQFDIIRTLGGGMVRSVRAMTGLWDDARPVVGCHAAFIEFEDGASATAIFSGYDHFNTRELVTGVDGEGFLMDPKVYAQARRELHTRGGADAELAAKRQSQYGGARTGPGRGVAAPQGGGGWVTGGPMVATFDHGDVRLTDRGLLVYGDDEQWEIPVDLTGDGHDGITRQFYDAVVNGRDPQAHGRWGLATLELILGVFQSGKDRKEIFLSRQTPTVDAP